MRDWVRPLLGRASEHVEAPGSALDVTLLTSPGRGMTVMESGLTELSVCGYAGRRVGEWESRSGFYACPSLSCRHRTEDADPIFSSNFTFMSHRLHYASAAASC